MDRDGTYANKHRDDLNKEIQLIDRAIEGDPQAKEEIEKKYPYFKDNLPGLKQTALEDWVKEKVNRDRENLEAGRPVTPDTNTVSDSNTNTDSDSNSSTPPVNSPG